MADSSSLFEQYYKQSDAIVQEALSSAITTNSTSFHQVKDTISDNHQPNENTHGHQIKNVTSGQHYMYPKKHESNTIVSYIQSMPSQSQWTSSSTTESRYGAQARQYLESWLTVEKEAAAVQPQTTKKPNTNKAPSEHTSKARFQPSEHTASKATKSSRHTINGHKNYTANRPTRLATGKPLSGNRGSVPSISNNNARVNNDSLQIRPTTLSHNNKMISDVSMAHTTSHTNKIRSKSPRSKHTVKPSALSSKHNIKINKYREAGLSKAERKLMTQLLDKYKDDSDEDDYTNRKDTTKIESNLYGSQSQQQEAEEHVGQWYTPSDSPDEFTWAMMKTPKESSSQENFVQSHDCINTSIQQIQSQHSQIKQHVPTTTSSNNRYHTSSKNINYATSEAEKHVFKGMSAPQSWQTGALENTVSDSHFNVHKSSKGPFIHTKTPPTCTDHGQITSKEEITRLRAEAAETRRRMQQWNNGMYRPDLFTVPSWKQSPEPSANKSELQFEDGNDTTDISFEKMSRQLLAKFQSAQPKRSDIGSISTESSRRSEACKIIPYSAIKEHARSSASAMAAEAIRERVLQASELRRAHERRFLRQILRSWYHEARNTRRQHRMREVLSRISIRRLRTMRLAFQYWNQLRLSRKRMEAIAIGRARFQYLHVAWTRWREFIIQQHQLKEQQAQYTYQQHQLEQWNRAVHHYSIQCLSKMFCRWYSLTLAAREYAREKAAHAARKAHVEQFLHAVEMKQKGMNRLQSNVKVVESSLSNKSLPKTSNLRIVPKLQTNSLSQETTPSNQRLHNSFIEKRISNSDGMVEIMKPSIQTNHMKKDELRNPYTVTSDASMNNSKPSFEQIAAYGSSTTGSVSVSPDHIATTPRTSAHHSVSVFDRQKESICTFRASDTKSDNFTPSKLTAQSTIPITTCVTTNCNSQTRVTTEQNVNKLNLSLMSISSNSLQISNDKVVLSDSTILSTAPAQTTTDCTVQLTLTEDDTKDLSDSSISTLSHSSILNLSHSPLNNGKISAWRHNEDAQIFAYTTNVSDHPRPPPEPSSLDQSQIQFRPPCSNFNSKYSTSCYDRNQIDKNNPTIPPPVKQTFDTNHSNKSSFTNSLTPSTATTSFALSLSSTTKNSILPDYMNQSSRIKEKGFIDASCYSKNSMKTHKDHKQVQQRKSDALDRTKVIKPQTIELDISNQRENTIIPLTTSEPPKRKSNTFSHNSRPSQSVGDPQRNKDKLQIQKPNQLCVNTHSSSMQNNSTKPMIGSNHNDVQFQTIENSPNRSVGKYTMTKSVALSVPTSLKHDSTKQYDSKNLHDTAKESPAVSIDRTHILRYLNRSNSAKIPSNCIKGSTRSSRDQERRLYLREQLKRAKLHYELHLLNHYAFTPWKRVWQHGQFLLNRADTYRRVRLMKQIMWAWKTFIGLKCVFKTTNSISGRIRSHVDSETSRNVYDIDTPTEAITKDGFARSKPCDYSTSLLLNPAKNTQQVWFEQCRDIIYSSSSTYKNNEVKHTSVLKNESIPLNEDISNQSTVLFESTKQETYHLQSKRIQTLATKCQLRRLFVIWRQYVHHKVIRNQSRRLNQMNLTKTRKMNQVHQRSIDRVQQWLATGIDPGAK